MPPAVGLDELGDIVWPTPVVPIPEAVNPLADEVGDRMPWAESIGLVTSPAAAQRFAGLRAGRLAARCYPAAGRSELELIVDWCNWLFLFDDVGDETTAGADPQRWERLVVPCFEALTVTASGGGSGGRRSPALARGLRDLVQRTCVRMPAAWCDRLRGHVTSFMSSYLDAAPRRRQHRPPTMLRYLDHRRDSGAMRVVLDLAELVEHMEIPPGWYELPEHQTLLRITNDAVCWSNDLCSLRKEISFDEPHNLVLVVGSATGCSLQDAVDRAAGMLQASVDAFMAGRRLMEHLVAASDLPTDRREGLLSCLGTYGAWLRGNLDFIVETDRYAGPVTTEPGATPAYLEPLLEG